MKLKNVFFGVLVLVAFLSTSAKAQFDLFQTKVLKGGDSTMTVNIAPFEEPEIWLGDSSNSRNDTLEIYIVSSNGLTLGAVLSPLNDTGIVYPANEKNTTVITTDGTLSGFSFDVTRPYQIYINNKGISTKRTHVTVTAKKRTYGELLKDKTGYAYGGRETRFFY